MANQLNLKKGVQVPFATGGHKLTFTVQNLGAGVGSAAKTGMPQTGSFNSEELNSAIADLASKIRMQNKGGSAGQMGAIGVTASGAMTAS